MGWCSGTNILDNVIEKLAAMNLPEEQQLEIVTVLIKAMEDNDYDCHSDSRYYGTPIMDKAMIALGHEFDEWD